MAILNEAVMIDASSQRSAWRSRAPRSRTWLAALVTVLGVYLLFLARSAPPLLSVLVVGSGLLVMSAPWIRRWGTTAAAVLLVVGTVPIAVLTWWSLIVPLVAVLALAIGLPTIVVTTRVPQGASAAAPQRTSSPSSASPASPIDQREQMTTAPTTSPGDPNELAR